MKRIDGAARIGTALIFLSTSMVARPLLLPAAPGDWHGDGYRGDTAVRYSDGQRVEIAGAVSENVYGGTTCRVRGDDGRTYSVQATSRLDLRRDQRVRVTGEWRGGVVQNAGINLLDGSTGSGNYSNGQKVEITASVITEVNGGRVLNVRGDNGARYLVSASSAITARRDQRVKVTGVWRDGMIADAGVNFIDGNNDGRPDYGTGSANEGQRMEFLGTVTDRVDGSSFRVDADNGASYRVQSTSPVRLRRNERVKITGVWSGGAVTGAGVNIIDGNGRPGSDPSEGQYSEGQRIEFPGTVLEDTRNRGTFRVRGDNNVTYTVSVPRTVNLNRGQRVRVTGNWRGGIVTDAGVNLL